MYRLPFGQRDQSKHCLSDQKQTQIPSQLLLQFLNLIPISFWRDIQLKCLIFSIGFCRVVLIKRANDYKSHHHYISMSQDRGEQINQIKLIAVGDSGVGKTSILTRFTYEKFNDYSEPTLGAAFLTKKHTLPTGKSIEFHIWDTAGQQKYRSIAPIYYRQAKIALCVYDITSQRSYEVMKKWVEELLANGPKDMVLAVVGNKIDRCDEEQVDYAVVKEYATSLGAILKLVSAKQGKNIDDLFNTVGQMAVKKRGDLTANTGGTKVTNKKDKKKKSGCC